MLQVHAWIYSESILNKYQQKVAEWGWFYI